MRAEELIELGLRWRKKVTLPDGKTYLTAEQGTVDDNEYAILVKNSQPWNLTVLWEASEAGRLLEWLKDNRPSDFKE